jgi:hypothetical protein
MNTYLNDLGVQVSILAGIVILIAGVIASSWFIGGLAVVWLIATIAAVANASRKGGL